MRLKKIKLAGFKSFVDPTTVPFAGNLTAIVGPNGCGKSNVIDAVRWVLGESSARHLRGDAMTDVIFNGAAQRKPISQASVELVFDNSDGRLAGSFAEYSEVSVKRQVNREAQSFYFLNGNKCRKRDITDLFLGTGLGPRSYAIIEQGMISRLIESRPQELRLYIEEAAGISKYKERRRETENRLRHTKDNLDRLLDVRETLGSQLEKLQQQAAMAKRYKTLRADERQKKAELAAIRYLKLQQQISQSQQRTAENQQQLAQLAAESAALERQQSTAQDSLTQRQLQQESAQQQLYQLGNQITKAEQQIQHQAEQKQYLQTELEQLTQTIQEQQAFIDANQEEAAGLQQQSEASLLTQHQLAEQVASCEQQREAIEAELGEWTARWQQASQRHTEVARELAGQQSKQQLIQQLYQQTQQRQQQLAAQLAEQAETAQPQRLAELEQQIDMLSERAEHETQQRQQMQEQKLQLESHRQQLQQQLMDSKEQLHRQQAKAETLAQWVAQQQAEHQQQMQALGISGLGPISQQLKVETGWEKAVETVFADFLTAEAVESLPTLSQPPENRLVLLSPSQTVAARRGTLAEKLAGCDSLRQLANQIYLVKHDSDAEKIVTALPEGCSVVSQTGIWRGPGWVIYPGAARGELVSRQELESLWQSIEQQLAKLDFLQEQEQALIEQLSELNQQLEQSGKQVIEAQQQLSRYQHQLALLRQQWQAEQQRTAAIQAELDKVDAQLQLQQQNLTLLAQSLLQTETESQQTDAQQQELQHSRETQLNQRSHIQAQLERLKAEQHKAALQHEGRQARLTALKGAEQRASQQLAGLHDKLQSCQQGLGRTEGAEWDQGKLDQMLAQKLQQQALVSEIGSAINQLQQQQHNAKQQQQQLLLQQQQLSQAQSELNAEQQGLSVRAEGQVAVLEEMTLELQTVLQQLSSDAEEESHQRALDSIGRAIARLGAINLAAIEEYEQQAERKRYLDAQHEDLTAAIDTLESAIRRIDRECQSRFKHTFNQVNSDLQQLFPKVFGGGSAHLELTGDNLLETGVTIMARPPGKRNATIQLLSGGEKALTALSLVFAIFRLNPAPFCMLDEVDAPLDDVNVGRYCNLVKEMSSEVQFIYISHNKVSMEMAEQLSGVTMLEPGVSRLVSVDVDEAVALAGIS